MGMITCDNCGAQYDEEADKCPYCGSDNFGKVVQEHEDIINGLKRSIWNSCHRRLLKRARVL